MKMKPITTRKAWSDSDVTALLRAYYTFLNYQQSGEAYTKASLVRQVAADLERSKGSIECKMMNVSAILQMHNQEWVTGYKPLSNVNKELVSQVCQFFNIQSKVA